MYCPTYLSGTVLWILIPVLILLVTSSMNEVSSSSWLTSQSIVGVHVAQKEEKQLT